MLSKKKIPKFLSKPLKEQRYQKQILGRIYITEDKDFLNGLYTRDESGNYLLKPDLSPEEIKRLKSLAKSIKANRGVVKKGRLILLAVLIGCILIFNLVLKNWLAELAVEHGLESAFVAQADINGMRLALLQGRISFDHLEVADRKKPMRNLFELGKTEISFNVIELLKGKDTTVDSLGDCIPGIDEFDRSVRRSVEIEVKYSGYIARQNEKIGQFRRMEEEHIPDDLDYGRVAGISSEAREKLERIRPRSLGQASRIAGVKPADVTNLLYYMRKVHPTAQKGETRGGKGRGTVGNRKVHVSPGT